MSGPQYLQTQANVVRTRMGAFLPDQSVAMFRGKNLHQELNHLDWMGLYLFGITGRMFDATQITLLNAIWSFTSYPDARLWNNRVAALAGSTRSTGNLGISAAIALSEANIYGRGIDICAITFLLNSHQKIQAGATLEECVLAEIKAHRRIAGYGRPITSADERIAPMLALMERQGVSPGVHLQLAFGIEKFLLAGRWRWKMNYGSFVAALAADLGLSAAEYYAFMLPAFLAGMQPCYLEAAKNPEGAFLPLSCSSITYRGKAKRAWL